MTKRQQRRRQHPQPPTPPVQTVLQHDPRTRSMHGYFADLDRDPLLFADMARAMARQGVAIVVGHGLLMALLQRLGTAAAVWPWLLDVANTCQAPIVVNIPTSPHDSHTVTLPPASWDAERVRGYLARRLPALEAEYGPPVAVDGQA